MVLSKILDITGSMEVGRLLSNFVLSPFLKNRNNFSQLEFIWENSSM